MERENKDGWIKVQKPVHQPIPPKYVPKFPYPQRQQRIKENLKFKEFLNIFRKLKVNIPLVEALEQIPSHVNFMKQIIAK